LLLHFPVGTVKIKLFNIVVH